MSFKARLCLLGLCVFFSVGCGLHLFEKVKDAGALSYSGKGYSCVGQIPGHFQSYLNDQLSDAEVTSFIRCLQNSFTSFAQLTRGREEATYAPDEIRRFLQKYFIKDRVISDELMHQYMVIKQVFVGGSLDTITRTELAQAIDLLEDVRREAIRLKPHLRVLNAKLVAQENPRDLGQRLNAAGEALNQTIQLFTTKLQTSTRDYPLKDLASFLTEFRKFVNWDSEVNGPVPVQSWISLLGAFKGVAVSPLHPKVIRATDWAPLLRSMSRWYLGFLQYEVGLKGQVLRQGIGLQNTVYLANQVFSLADDAIDRQPVPVLGFDQVTTLLEAFSAVGFIDPQFRVTSLDHVFRMLVTRVFGDALTPPAERKSDGLSHANVANMRAEFYRWAYVQMRLDRERRAGVGIEAPGEDGVPTLQLPPATDAAKSTGPSVVTLNGSDWTEFLKVKTLMKRPLFPEDVNKVILVPAKSLGALGVTQGFYNLSAMNLLRSIVGMVFRGYAADPNGRYEWTAGITSDEMVAFYGDFREFGVDLGIVDPSRTFSGSLAFTEATLFTYSSRGIVLDAQGIDGELSLIDAMEFYAMIYTAGQTAKDIYAQVRMDCPAGPNDANGLAQVSRTCVQADVPKLISTYMTNMPFMREYLQTIDAERLKAYSKVLLDSAAPDLSSPWIGHYELSTFAGIVNFAEAVMTRYDTDGDGILRSHGVFGLIYGQLPVGDNEFTDAAHVFAGYIQKVSRDKNKYWTLWRTGAEGAFYYIVDHKKMPDSWNMFQILGDQIPPNVSLDRYELAQVFQAITQSLLEANNQKHP